MQSENDSKTCQRGDMQKHTSSFYCKHMSSFYTNKLYVEITPPWCHEGSQPPPPPSPPPPATNFLQNKKNVSIIGREKYSFVGITRSQSNVSTILRQMYTFVGITRYHSNGTLIIYTIQIYEYSTHKLPSNKSCIPN